MRGFVDDYRLQDAPAKHPALLEPATLAFGLVQGIVGAVIGLELLTRVGVTPNTSIIGAIIAIAASRLPLPIFARFRSLDRQNLLQTVISAATFGAANALLLPMGVLWLLDRADLVPAMFVGATLGMITGAVILYAVFDSRVYPAAGAWPPGIATAECLIASDKGGRRALLLGIGGVIGGLGRYLGMPMDIFGTCWIGNRWALAMFGAGLLASGYSLTLFDVDMQRLYVPHGIMIGAGVVAVFQMMGITLRQKGRSAGLPSRSTSDRTFTRALGFGSLALAVGAGITALLAGLHTQMSPAGLGGFVIFAAFGALVSQLIVGISAMHAGWFPAFAAALIFLVLGMALGFPPLALAFLVGFTASSGPAFADLGYDLKTGWVIRGSGQFPAYEREGRRQQMAAALLGFGVAAALVYFAYPHYFRQKLLPPVDSVFAATIRSPASSGVALHLLMWAVPGAALQWLGGSSRQMGILLATGLLIHNPAAGWTAMISLATRGVLLRKYGRTVESPMFVLAGGFIAGSALTSFATATLRLNPGEGSIPGHAGLDRTWSHPRIPSQTPSSFVTSKGA